MGQFDTRGHYLGLILSLSLLTPVANASPVEVLAGFADGEDNKYVALAISSSETAAMPEIAIDLALVIDLTASQSGAHRSQTVELAYGIIQGLRGGSRVQAWLTSRQDPLMARPAAVGSSEVRELGELLKSAVPGGASDLPRVFRAINQWLSDTSGSLPKVVLSMGDGQSTLVPLDVGTMDRQAEQLRQARVVWYDVPIGAPRLSPCSLLAIQTGGCCLQVAKGGPELRTLLETIQSPVFYLNEITTTPGISLANPGSLSVLRHDQETLVLAKLQGAGPHTAELRCSVQGAPSTQTVEIPSFETTSENAYLPALFETMQSSPQSVFVGDAAEVLTHGRQQLAYRFERMMEQAQRAIEQRDIAAAEELFREASAFAPDDPQVELGRRAVDRLKQSSAAIYPEKPSIVTEKRVSPPQDIKHPETEVVADPIEDVKAKERIEAQRLHRVVRDSISQAQKLSRTDTKAALRLLKQTLAMLDGYSDLSAASNLRQRVEQELRTIWRQGQRAQSEKLQRERALAGFESNQRQTREAITQQQQTKALMNRYRHLWQQGNFADAERVADQVVARREEIGSAEGIAAERQSRLAGDYRQANETEVAKQEGWWRALSSIDKAAIPFPDSTPLVYPPATFWEEISIRREKYRAVDLTPATPAEDAIRQSLARPVTFNFVDTPLGEVVNFLKDYTGVNVVLDVVALEEVGVDLDIPVTLSLSSVSLRSALRLLLKPLELTYLITDEVLLLTSYQVAENELITKVYPVGDLVVPIGNFTSGGVGTIGGPGGNQGGGLGQGAPGGGRDFGAGSPRAGSGDSENSRRPNRPRTPRRPAEDLQRIIEEVAGDWEAYFERAPLDASMNRKLVLALTERGDHSEAAGLLQALIRHQSPPPWVYEALSLSLRLAGEVPEEIHQSLLSLVDLAPASLDLRRRLAVELAIMGQADAALELLDSAVAIEPGSARTQLLLLEQAASVDDLNRVTRTASALLARDWPRLNEEIHAQARGFLKQMEERCRRRGELNQADRCAAIAAAVSEADLEIVVSWHGETDIDLAVVEPRDLLCSASLPQTVQGGVLIADEHLSSERYIAHRAFPGKYEVLLRAHWGAPTAGTAYVDVTKHRGTEREVKQRHSVQIVEGSGKITLSLEEGRRDALGSIGSLEELRLPPLDSGPSPKSQLHQMLGGMFSANVQPEDLEQPITANGPLAQVIPFVTGAQAVVSGGAVAFDPVVTYITNGPSLTAQAVVSADRRYVRMTLVPVIQNVQSLDQVRSIPITGVAR